MKNRQLVSGLLLIALSAVASAQEDIDSVTNVAGLNQLSNSLRINAEAEKREATRLAPLLGIPVKGTNPQGQGFELMAIRDGRPFYYCTDNAQAAISTRAVDLYPGGILGLNVDGGTYTIREWDQGTALGTHQELTGGVINGDAEGVNGDHATHVAGTMIGWGVDTAARGMSRNYLKSFGWTDDGSEMATEGAAGAFLSNHSYGAVAGWYVNPSFNTLWSWVGDTSVSTSEDWGFGFYDNGAAAWDTICYDAPYYLPVKSAGNNRNNGPADGTNHYHGWAGGALFTDSHYNQSTYDTLPYNATAKNILIVGAVNDVPSYVDASSVVMSNFSSWGPTDDGRIKPDLVGNGVGVYSSIATNDTAYASFSGTSMASPNVTGTLSLLVEHWLDTHPKRMRSATMKALAIHTARECGPNTGPDYMFGWGLLDANEAAKTITADVTVPMTVSEQRLINNKPHSFWVYCPDTPVNLRATIAWTDKAGPVEAATVDSTTSHLVNDLDLRITVPGVGDDLPWTLDPANPANGAGLGDNFRDNVEQVDGTLYGDPAGWFLVTVSHKGTLSSPNYQDYSLILTGTSKRLVIQKVTLTPTTIQGGSGNIAGKVQLTEKAPIGGVTVKLVSDNPRALVPASVVVAAGTKIGNFTVTTKPVGVERTFKITASIAPQSKSATGTLTL